MGSVESHESRLDSDTAHWPLSGPPSIPRRSWQIELSEDIFNHPIAIAPEADSPPPPRTKPSLLICASALCSADTVMGAGLHMFTLSSPGCRACRDCYRLTPHPHHGFDQSDPQAQHGEGDPRRHHSCRPLPASQRAGLPVRG
ncbi:hypothetical protein A1Q2_02364 [Trichosporon asahii var. asahii CBS 8904]|uniref:Uncharacterized protein n=1 Tax=Trichosporon asahii var. asahii (strain CBS 8904) TaxID=1220162 RepID=K1VGU2_TRIAC|nr:hypothetical protein A1Q2_02364 [Trichosporon asahii var. asahii CBS 8904]